ncbi:MAG: exodeoxyribonuclease VII small subunit [Bacteroidota bacterium]
MAKKLTYESAITEIETILQEIENNETDVDSLTIKVKRVSELLNYCKTKLRNTEEEVNNILESLDDEAE